MHDDMDNVTRESIVEAAQRVAATTGGILTREDFERSTGIKQDHLNQAFPGGWSEVVQLAGIRCPDFSWSTPQPRPLDLAGIAATGVLACAFLGATTNAVNGAVSPRYFITILHWYNVENVLVGVLAASIFWCPCESACRVTRWSKAQLPALLPTRSHLR